MRTRLGTAVAAVLTAAAALAGCGGGGAGGGGAGGGGDDFTIGLLLPSAGIPRWERFDKPLITRRLKELCPGCRVMYANAGEDVVSQRQQMTSMITNGAQVLILDAVDPKAMRSSVQAARRAGVPVVAYDRLAQGPISGFVTFDGTLVGRLQAEALLKAMGKQATGGLIVMMNGDPASPNADWYRRASLSVLKGRVRIGKSYDTIGWRADNANANMRAAIAALGADRIDGVLAVNDAAASGVVAALRAVGVTRMPPITGQDADLDGIRRIVRRDQYMTVYKPFRSEAGTAAAMAVALGRGRGLGGIARTTVDSATARRIPAVLLTPIAVTRGNIRETVVKDGVYSADRICTPALRDACAEAGLVG